MFEAMVDGLTILMSAERMLFLTVGVIIGMARAIGEMLDAPPHWTADEAAHRIAAAYGEEVVCAQLEQVYSEVVNRS